MDGRYRVEKGPVGEPSGEAVVYRCADLEGGGAVALKHYHEKMSPKASVVAQLLSIRHRDIVAIRGWGVWAGRAYEVMDYCEGGSLADYMPFDEETLRRVCRSVVRGLHHLHQKNQICQMLQRLGRMGIRATRTCHQAKVMIFSPCSFPGLPGCAR